MNTWIVFFRGINVGGRNIVPMAKLRALLEGINCTPVKTYIQSGNAILQSPHADSAMLGAAIRAACESEFSFVPQVLSMTVTELADTVLGNPFTEAESNPKSLHVFFLAAEPAARSVEKLKGLQSTSERIQLVARTLYLHAPDGIGRSRLAASVEKTLDVPVTARNWRTVGKVLQLAQEL